MSYKYDLTIPQGEDFLFPVVYYEDVAQQIPKNLTGYTARMQIRQTHDAATAIYTGQSPAGGITIVDAEGQININMTNAQTAAFPAPFRGFYDLELTDGAGKKRRVLEGRVTITPEVTKDA